jgi:hypothetical protein
MAETLCLHYRDLYLIRWRLHAQATKFQQIQSEYAVSLKEQD